MLLRKVSYLSKENETRFLVQYLSPFLEHLLESKLIDSWFYIRYRDTSGPHIRIRLKGKREEKFRAFCTWVESCIFRGWIRDSTLANYEREVERYGGETVIGDAETLFCSDTETSVLLIRGILSKKITFPDYIVAALSCVDILKGFGLDLDAQIAFFERLGIEKKALEGFRKWKSVLLSAASVLFGSGSPKENEEEMAYLLQAFEKRKAAQEIYLKKLQDALGSSPAVLDKIFGSILHMHCNRMLGTQPDLEKKAMAFAAHALASFAQLKLENATPKPLGNCKLGRLLN